MTIPQNPFRLRAAEQISSNQAFVRLFGVPALDLFPHPDVVDRVQVFRSTPGGGKSTLFRLFTPESLTTIYQARNQDFARDLYERLRIMKAIGTKGPRLLGVALSCGRTFAALDDIELDEQRRNRLFLALLNARSVIAMLRGACALKLLDFPGELDRVSVNMDGGFLDAPVGSGRLLYEWAKQLEIDICAVMDSFEPEAEAAARGHDEFIFSRAINAQSVQVDNKNVVDRIVLMLDDVHQLAPGQRTYMYQYLVQHRPVVGVWVAERLEILSEHDVLAPGTVVGRDLEPPIYLEGHWRNDRSAFSTLVANIANRRATRAQGLGIESFATCLGELDETHQWDSAVGDGAQVLFDRLVDNWAVDIRYRDLVHAAADVHQPTTEDRAIFFRSLEILLERDRRDNQLRLDISLEPSPKYLNPKSDVRNAAELFLAREFDLPYYYGITRLSAIGSYNVEQFLGVASDLFDQVIAAALTQKATTLTPVAQDKAIRFAARGYVNSLPKRLTHGRAVRRLVHAIATFGDSQTYRPTASYPPGVNGVAITLEQRTALLEGKPPFNTPDSSHLVVALRDAVANNVLEIHETRCKHQDLAVLYLNRLACAAYDLPLAYGNFREIGPDRLASWLHRGVEKVDNQEDPLF